MNTDPNYIPGDKNDINDQKLMDYIDGKLSVQDKMEMEGIIAESGLINDAVQGLQQFKNTNNLSTSVNQLNAGLHKQLLKKKHQRQKLQLKNDQWIFLAIIIILAMIIIGYIVIRQRLVN